MEKQYSIKKVGNGYIATMDIDLSFETRVFTDFDKMMDVVALHFGEIKISEKYRLREI